jgi:hypothetical protein
VLCSEHLAEASLPYHFVHLVLVDNLAHIEGAPLCFEVKCVTILQKIKVFLTNLKPTQTIEISRTSIVLLALLFAQSLQKMTEFLHIC